MMEKTMRHISRVGFLATCSNCGGGGCTSCAPCASKRKQKCPMGAITPGELIDLFGPSIDPSPSPPPAWMGPPASESDPPVFLMPPPPIDTVIVTDDEIVTVTDGPEPKLIPTITVEPSETIYETEPTYTIVDSADQYAYSPEPTLMIADSADTIVMEYEEPDAEEQTLTMTSVTMNQQSVSGFCKKCGVKH